MAYQKKSRRRHEAVDPNPVSAPVKFQRPPTLAEQIARFLGQHERYVKSQEAESPDDAEDFDIPDEDSPESPHELVYDEQLNRELPRYEKALLDRQRAAFDEALKKRIQDERNARAAAERVAKEKASDDAPQKSKKRVSSPVNEDTE